MVDSVDLRHMKESAYQGSFRWQKGGNYSQNSNFRMDSIGYPASKDSLHVGIDTLKGKAMPEPVQIFNLLSGGENKFDYKPSKVFLERNKTESIAHKNIYFEPNSNHKSHLNWTLLLGLLSVSLILIIKNNYKKFLDQVVNAMINFQLSEKILREKNILARRAYFMLNLNYILMFSLLILLILISINFNITKRYFIDYLIIFSSVSILILIRLGIIYFNGFLFQMKSVTSEYIHIIFLINKNLGIILLPVIFTSIYTPTGISKILLTIAFLLVFLATLLKIVRGFQIIMKNRVLLFYSILYLCTLELLPLVLGSKLIIALR
jgi:hypothetical protein